MTSAENPEGIASHPLTAALPAFHRSFSLFSAILLPSACRSVSLRYRIELGQGNLAKQRQGQQLPCERPGGERNCSPRSGLASLALEQSASRVEKGPAMSI